MGTDLAVTVTGLSLIGADAGNYTLIPPSLTANITQATTTLGSVAGTASFGGTAALTATLTSAATGLGIAGQTVDFTLDGNPVGFAVTDSNGIATLTGVATSDAAGTDAGAVVASFDGTPNYAAANDATGDLVVSQVPATLGSVAGTASFGGTVTLTATLTSSVTGLGIAGQTVDFSVEGNPVVTAVTNTSGVATVTGVATTAAAGTYPGAVAASFAGDSSYAAATPATGDLVVSQAATTLGSVSGRRRRWRNRHLDRDPHLLGHGPGYRGPDGYLHPRRDHRRYGRHR